MRRLLTCVALLAALPLAASAQTIGAAGWPSERAPRPLASRPVAFPPYQLKTLPNGLQVLAGQGRRRAAGLQRQRPDHAHENGPGQGSQGRHIVGVRVLCPQIQRSVVLAQQSGRSGQTQRHTGSEIFD